MNYIKLYFTTHLQYWWLYIMSLGTFLFGYVFLMFGVLFLSNWGLNDIAAWIIGLLISSLLISSPILYINHKIALRYISKSRKKINVVMLTACNHLMTYLAYLAIFLMVLYGGN